MIKNCQFPYFFKNTTTPQAFLPAVLSFILEVSENLVYGFAVYIKGEAVEIDVAV